MKPADLKARLECLKPKIESICRISGTPGASIGVMCQGEMIFTHGYGHRDVEKKLAPDENTIYYLASLSKAVTGLAIGVLVEQGKMKWTTPVCELVDGFSQRDPQIEQESNMIDWLSHRTGLASKNSMWTSEVGHASLKREAALPMISYLEKVYDFRDRWLYSNWGWALADEVITALSGETWGAFLRSEIFDRLGMKRSTTNHNTSLDNVAEAYMALSNGCPYHLPRPFPGDGEVMEGAVAVQSCVSDLCRLYKAFMEAKSHQDSTGLTSTPGNPLAQIATITEAHIPLAPGSTKPERSYAIGWVRAELPTTLGAIGLNPTYMGKMPIAGKGLRKSELCLYHQGSNNTFLSSVHLLPESHSAVVVLTNSMANNDAADWLGEMLLEAVLDNDDKNDYVKMAEVSATELKHRWKRMREELETRRTPGTTCRTLHTYCGLYYNCVGTYRIEVYQVGDKLKMCFQGNREFSYDLKHYQFDTFSWLLTRDEDAHYGRFPVTRADFYLFAFNVSRVGSEAESVNWINDIAVPEGETFCRRGI